MSTQNNRPQKLSELHSTRKQKTTQPDFQTAGRPIRDVLGQPTYRADQSHDIAQSEQTVNTSQHPKQRRVKRDPANYDQDVYLKVSGVITMIEAQKRHKDRYNIYLDNVFAFGVSEATLVHFALFKNQTLTEERSLLIQRYEEENKLFERALNYLSHALHTKKQVQDKLASYTDKEAVISDILQRLEKLNLLNDQQYAKSYTRTAMNVQNKGPQKIKQELKQKGVSETDIRSGLAEYDDQTLADNLTQLANKKYQTYNRRYSNAKSLQKTRQFLYQKGYLSETIEFALEPLEEMPVDEEAEWDLIVSERDKYWRRYRKYDAKKRFFKVKQHLFQKRFASELIQAAMEEIGDEE